MDFVGGQEGSLPQDHEMRSNLGCRVVEHEEFLVKGLCLNLVEGQELQTTSLFALAYAHPKQVWADWAWSLMPKFDR
jgi:hypothetical protein